MILYTIRILYRMEKTFQQVQGFLSFLMMRLLITQNGTTSQSKIVTPHFELVWLLKFLLFDIQICYWNDYSNGLGRFHQVSQRKSSENTCKSFNRRWKVLYYYTIYAYCYSIYSILKVLLYTYTQFPRLNVQNSYRVSLLNYNILLSIITNFISFHKLYFLLMSGK